MMRLYKTYNYYYNDYNYSVNQQYIKLHCLKKKKKELMRSEKM